MKYRDQLPQLHGNPTLTDSGLETVLMFHHGIDLPAFAAFPLLDRPRETDLLNEYYRTHAAIGAPRAQIPPGDQEFEPRKRSGGTTGIRHLLSPWVWRKLGAIQGRVK